MKRSTVRLLRIGLTLVLVAAGLVLAVYWRATSQPPQRASAQRARSAVRTAEVAVTDLTLRIRGYGEVQAARTAEVAARITGRITAVHPDLRPGARFAADTVLIEIDDADYRLALTRAQAQLRSVRAELVRAEARQRVAHSEFALLADELADAGIEPERELVLREPLVAQARAAVARAQAAVDQAGLELSRTTIRAPFPAVVRSEHAATGDVVQPGLTLAQLVARSPYHVVVAVPVERLPLIRFTADGREASAARVLVDHADGRWSYAGHAIALLPDVSPTARMARVLIAVEAPQTPIDTPEGPPLLLGGFVEVVIDGPQRQDLLRVPKAALIDGERIHVYGDDDTLAIIEPRIVARTQDAVYIREGLADGDRVVVSPLARPMRGMPLRRIDAEQTDSANGGTTDNGR
ncbi:MAG: efflux RND transporter periplasmic adaptor subunit [Planctomycetota bacterium]